MVMADATTVSVVLADPAATRALGARLAAACEPGTLFLLRGPLGAGKTTLVDGFTKALGAQSATSPTFVIAHSHTEGRHPVWHLDLYRIEDERQVAELDLTQYLSDAAITLCEWPERASDLWPSDALEIELTIEGEARHAFMKAGGPKSHALLQAFQEKRT